MRIPIFEKINLKHFINKCFNSDKKKFVKYSRTVKTEGRDHISAQISLYTHVVEKGLTMPEMRLGFGQEVLCKLMGLCQIWADKYDKTDPFYVQAVRTILEYKQLHTRLNYNFEDSFRSNLESFVIVHSDYSPSEQLVFDGSEQFFSANIETFPTFAHSRHSVRNFSDEEIPLQILTDSIDLAQSAPSSCNRQTTRVHVLSDKTDIRNVLSLQNGNRGFGHLVDKLLVITYNTSCYGSVKERHLGYIDAGLFTMNLLYALHYNRVGACTLNWCDSPTEDAKLRSIVKIDDSETIVLFIACGKVPSHSFLVPISQKNKGDIITTIH